jgi:O-acetyl-ADP-ribose deacetylase (regulator of RNase III)
MTKRTKRKNNKLSKRKYSRRRLSRYRVNKKKLSRHRVSKKKLSRRRIYQKKYRQSGGSEIGGWEIQLLSLLEERNQGVEGQYPQTEVGPINVFIYSDGGGNPKHIYAEREQTQLTSIYGTDGGTIKIHPDGHGIYNVTINKKEEYPTELYIPIPESNGEWCKVTHEIGIQIQAENTTRTRRVFVGDKNELYPGDLCVVEEYSIIKNKINKLKGGNSKTNLVFAAESKDSEPTYVYFINDELRSEHFCGDDGKLLILKNPPKTPEEYESRTKETQNVDGSTPSDPSLSNWRVKHWSPSPEQSKCPYGGITDLILDYDTPNGIILLFSPRWGWGDEGTQFSTTISFDGTYKIEPIKIILRERTQDDRCKDSFNKLFKQLSIMTKTIKEIQRFLTPDKAAIVVSQGSVVDFGVGEDWDHQNIAIVNAANNGGISGGGVDGAITLAGGVNLATDRRKLPVLAHRQRREIRIPTGDAVPTGPNDYGKLNASYVIHAVGPDYRDISIPEGNILLQQAYEKSMGVAKENDIKYIGFSLLSSGIFRGKPEIIRLDEVLRIGIDAVKANLYEGLKEVHFVAFTEDEKEALIRQIETTSGSGPGLGPNLEPEPEPEPEPEQESYKIIRINNSEEIIKQIMNQTYSFDKPIYTDNKGLILIKGLYSQETGFILSAQLKHSGKEAEAEGSVISIQVAGNSLLPGGRYQRATRDGNLDVEQIKIIPKHHPTQEESVMDSLLHAAVIKGQADELPQVFENMIGKNAELASPMGQRIKHRIYPPEAASAIQFNNGEGAYPATNGRPWGCSKPDGGVDDTMSIQGVDFTDAIPEGDDKLMEYALKYNFAYTLDDADMALSANYYLSGVVDNTSGSLFKTDVVFCYGPNVYAESDKSNESGTMTRSKIKDYIEDEHHQKYFRECVKMSYKATLISMKENGVKYPILCYVSGGIYSGQRKRRPANIFIRRQIPIIIDEINNELDKPFNNIFLCG